ncbi:hypothetical protein CES86_3136 [Brucella lupini]|uniref:Uncharacterized protein n=1 Tax=Brucella lupini TaxID=255457 RepID=A0A256GHZ6_9HYPH|nr:hypothetical protein CES86_3136 [Brucella lupini]
MWDKGISSLRETAQFRIFPYVRLSGLDLAQMQERTDSPVQL